MQSNKQHVLLLRTARGIRILWKHSWGHYVKQTLKLREIEAYFEKHCFSPSQNDFCETNTDIPNSI